jgi:hypothetical protein
MRRKLILKVVLGATAMLLLTPVTAVAAMDATLSSAHARPGDSVLLLTDDHNGAGNYGSLASENHQSIYLASTTAAGNWSADGCTGAGYQMVGQLQWRGNAGGLALSVPSVPPGDYWLFMKTHEQCWRIGGSNQGDHGPLVLSVGNTPADNQDVATRWTPSPAPSSGRSGGIPWMTVIGAGVLALLTLAAWRRRRILW